MSLTQGRNLTTDQCLFQRRRHHHHHHNNKGEQMDDQSHTLPPKPLTLHIYLEERMLWAPEIGRLLQPPHREDRTGDQMLAQCKVESNINSPHYTSQNPGKDMLNHRPKCQVSLYE